MYSKVLLSLFAVACALPTDLVPTPQCLYNGHIYPPGTFQPSVCVHCQCSSTGQVTCAPQFCPPPICVDAVKDPSKCCPVCPNGNLIQIILKIYIFIKMMLLPCVSEVTKVILLIQFWLITIDNVFGYAFKASKFLKLLWRFTEMMSPIPI